MGASLNTYPHTHNRTHKCACCKEIVSEMKMNIEGAFEGVVIELNTQYIRPEDPLAKDYRGALLCVDCRTLLELNWIKTASMEDLLAQVNHEWASDIVARMYKDRLAEGGPAQ